jgi:hypothetical protein
MDGGSPTGVSTRISGAVSFNTVRVTSSGVPDSVATNISSSGSTDATVTIDNTGNSPETYFLDPRLDTRTTYPLSFFGYDSGRLPGTGAPPQAIVPPFTDRLTMSARARRTIRVETEPMGLYPMAVSGSGRTVAATITKPDLPTSLWFCEAAEAGPFRQATTTTYTCSASARTDTIDDNVVITGGNEWASSTDESDPNEFNPNELTLVKPGQSVTLHATFQPTGEAAGTVARGFIAVETFNADSYSGDQLLRIPYAYTVSN